MSKIFLTIPQAAKMLGITSQLMRNWIKQGVIAPHHVTPSRRTFFLETQLLDFMGKGQDEEGK